MLKSRFTNAVLQWFSSYLTDRTNYVSLSNDCSAFVTETWLSAQGDVGKTVELAPSGFDVKSFPRQSRSRGGGIATVCKSTLGSNITFKTNL